MIGVRIASRLARFLLACPAFLCLGGGQQVVLRTDVHAVEISVVATDGKGKPAGGLRASDFRVWDNGKEQTIASFEKISSSQVASAEALPPNTYSNRIGKQGKPQVLSMILLDAVNTNFRSQVVMLRAVEHILEQIQPEERVAIYAFGSRFVTLHDFSSDKASLLAKLRKYHGEVPDRADVMDEFEFDLDIAPRPLVPPPKWEVARVRAAKAVDTFEALEAIANRVKGVPGRKNLLWISEGFPLTVGEAQAWIGLQNIGTNAERAQWRTFGPEMGRAMAALNNAGVAVYPIDARGLSKGSAGGGPVGLHDRSASDLVNDMINTMKEMASATGGKAFHDRNDREQGVREALDDSREVYVLTYSPNSIVHDGAYHRIRVQVSRPGVQVRYRRGYFAPNGDEAVVASVGESLTRTLGSPLDASEIGIQASPELGAGDDLKIAVLVDLAEVGLAHDTARWTGALRLEAVQIGPIGERYEGETQTAQLDLLPETYRMALTEGLKLEMKLKRNPAASAVRVAVADEKSGRTGSLTFPLPARPAVP